jgi:hypothetical protein
MRFVLITGMVLLLAGCGYCAPGTGGNTPGGKTAPYCTNKAGEGP